MCKQFIVGKEIVYIRKMSDYYIVKYNNKIQGGRDEKS